MVNRAGGAGGAPQGSKTTAFRHSNTMKNFGQAATSHQQEILSDLEEDKFDADEMEEDQEAVEVMKNSNFANNRGKQ